ncbi:ABC transporter substrate-binding protein [Glycomyces sp. YM15]|uniref:ABC transporter substrate-binding protein n=1 Tax=Glycomyces sp. YM15 TaxID=2800446 RepID=UPI001966CB67|nr:extracellular solute-binding protein [Glycomyces sp. YM15]
MNTRPIRTAIGAAAAAALALTAACSGGGADDGTITLSVGLFGDFGFGPLYEEYTKLHPEIEFEERIAEFADHHTNLTTHLATGSGTADIEAVEVGYISQYTSQPDRFHNLLELGADDLEGQWLDWKWQQALSKDGETLIGLGTDVGGMAMCYRRDLFEQAGLPVERDEVSALWADSWEDYVAVGRRYSAATDGAYFFESSGNMFRAMVEQADEGVYDREDNLVVESNPAIGQAWDLTVDAIEAGMSNRLQAWTPEWNAGFSEGTFATIICPAWMTSYIETNAPDSAGLWDIATVPGGAGNMGGSHLVLPSQGEHPEEAYAFIEWLTAPEQQLKVFEATGNFPSTPELYEDEALTGLTKAYFNEAPVGQIFTAAAQAVEPQYQGPLQGDVLATIGQGLGRIEDGSQTPEEAWSQVLGDLESF